MTTKESTKRRFIVQVSDETAAVLHELAALCTSANKRSGGYSSHGALSVSAMLAMLAMLAEDAAMVITRPGSWEGSNMAQVFNSHGYEV
jgi:hypothetical protein